MHRTRSFDQRDLTLGRRSMQWLAVVQNRPEMLACSTVTSNQSVNMLDQM